jgi:hypothetical protein
MSISRSLVSLFINVAVGDLIHSTLYYTDAVQVKGGVGAG